METDNLLDDVREALADRYVIERELGAGGMAIVYLAEDIKHHRKVAVKVLRPELAESVGANRFLREIQVAAGLNHPHILALHDSGEANGLLYYVMPFVDGESLRTRLQRKNKLPVEEAVRLALQVADGLSFAHSHDVVHRDIKPENILLANGHASLADFGIAQAMCAGCGEDFTVRGVPIGTPAYMSGEQAIGGDVDCRTDVYSLGCVLFEMLAGRQPYRGQNVEDLFALHLTDPIPSVLQYRRDVPQALDDVVRKALAKSRKDRFADASEFAKALRELNTGTAAAPARWGRSAYKFAGVLAFVFILAGASLLLNQPGDAQPVAIQQRIESLAVLPFVNLSGDALEQPFVDGMTDLLITRLAEVSAFAVSSRRSVMRYRETDKSLPDIAIELNVDAIVEGSVLRVGDRVRIGAQLIHATTDRHLWATDYEWDLQDVLALQSEVARAITEAITAELARPVSDSS